MKPLLQVLMERDDISKEEAEELIAEAREAMNECLDDGDQEAAYNICEEYFGLEPDYLFDLLE